MFQVAFSVVAAVLAVTQIASPVAANVFKFSSNLGTDSPDAFALNGRGSQIVAMTNFRENDNQEVTIHITTIGEGGIELSVPLAEFTPENDFGFLDLVGDHVTGQMLFVTEINQIDSVIKIYHANWYGGDWTLLQTLAPAANTSTELVNPPYYFGSKFGIDYKTNRAIAVGYGDAIPLGGSGVGYGKICVYEATSPSADQWLPTQVLSLPPASSSTVLPIRMGGSFVNMYDDVIVADTFIVSTVGGSPDYGLEIFTRGRNGLWSHQQSFTDTSTSAHVTLSVVYDETIVYSINNLDSPTDIGKSSVNIMHPNTPAFQSSTTSRRLSKKDDKAKPKDSKDSKAKPKLKPKPTPDPLEWSLVQTLWSPNHDFTTPSAGSDVGFGQDLGFFGNTLTVAEVGDTVNTGFLYIFERSSNIGMFTLQQTILPSISTNNFLSLHRLNNDMLMASSILTGGGPSNDIWLGNNTAWSCLNIKLEDAFGDGWDGARLRVTTPFKDKDYYAPMCHTNPLVFRYCPSEFSQEGKYRFEIVGSKAAKFAWEIRWLVYEESTGETYRGDHGTEMDFLFKHGRFTSGRIHHALSANATCQTCGGYPLPPAKPSPKPPAPKAKPSPAGASPGPDAGGVSDKPSPTGGDRAYTSRRLHAKAADDDHTASPSISPAPTLAVTADLNWAYMSMVSAGGDWFRDEYSGTHFYISDVSGQELISTGTMCGGVLTDSCVQSLSDGEYTLRVTGDLNMYSADHSWNFCGRLGSGSDSLSFSISNGVCVPLLRVTTADTCLVLNPVSGVVGYTVALGSFLITGITKDGMTTADVQSFETAVVQTIPGAVSGGVHVVSVTENNEANIYTEGGGGGGVVVKFTVQLKTQELGYDLLDVDSIQSLINMENNQLGSSNLSPKMTSELLGGTLSGGLHSFFSNVESVKLMFFQMGDLEFAKSPLEIHTSEEVKEVASDLDFVLADIEASANAHDARMKTLFAELGVGGYVLAGIAMVGVLVVFMKKQRNQAQYKTPTIASDFQCTSSVGAEEGTDEEEETTSI